MAVFRIIRIYEIPANNRIEATDRMLEALELGTEEDYHVTDLVREHGEKPAQSHPVDLRPPAKIVTIFKRQITGKWRLMGGESYAKIFSANCNSNCLHC